ncbi:MAG: gamma-glutamylcyclotransferase [Pseudomonadota bacterium]
MESGDLWVFGYGSLMWKPGFEHVERRLARLDGYARRFGMWSWHYRGTRERPGLVLGLDWAPESSCTGVAFRIAADREREIRSYLQERELISYAYFETLQPITLLAENGEEHVQALCYILDRTHPQYAGGLSIDQQVACISKAQGQSGPNAEYLHQTCSHLEAVGVADDALQVLSDRVRKARA